MQNTRVANRMANYRLFSGTLNLKIMVNGNSFYFGRVMASYAPYGFYDLGSRQSGDGSPASLLQNSQRLKLFIDPCESQGGTIALPFLWHADMLDLTSGDQTILGLMTFEELAPLKHANAAVSPITISVFAWMTDVKLSCPTQQEPPYLAPQAGDEYGSTPISSLATAVANAAGSLASAPTIGPYMRATSMAAGAMSSVAKMFGYSRPVDLASPTIVKPRPIPDLATTDSVDGSVKLTVDSKQELTIDPRTVGLSGVDELSLSYIASRETWVYSIPWATTATGDALLHNIRVQPIYSRNVTGTLGTWRAVPACTYAAMPFKYWRGTMRYRFMIVASSFHKGRLKFVWDPAFADAVPESNIQYTKVVDISNERDFVIDVAWGFPKTWCECTAASSVSGSNIMSASRFTSATTLANGILSVYVLNELSTPNSTAPNDITIQVFMSMCDDAEFSCPNNFIANMSATDNGVQPQSGQEYITPQNDVENEQLETNNAPTQQTSDEEYVSCNPKASEVDVVYMGEHITSFRQLMKRYNIDYHYASITPGIFNFTTSDFPMKFGYTPYGIRGTAPNKYDKATTTMMRYLAMGFLFYRGGVRRKYIMQSNTTTPQFSTMTITRNSTSNNVSAPTTTALTITTATTLSDSLAVLPTGHEGMTWMSERHNQMIEAEIPFYRSNRFALCRRPNAIATASQSIPYVEDLTHTFTANVWTPATANIFTSMVAGAEDSSFFCFQGCLPIYFGPTLV